MLNQDYRQCENIIRQGSKTFFSAFSRLPMESRNGIFAIYAFCRQADDTVDGDNLHPTTALAGLEQEFDQFSSGITPNRFYWRALRDTVDRFEITDLTPFRRLLRGQRQDLVKTRYQNLDDLLAYCDDVATSVGDMIWHIISPQRYVKLTPLKQALGRAMQLTNILRDIGEDAARGRIYLPQEIMDDCRYTPEQLRQGLINPEFINLWESIAVIAEDYYQIAQPLYKHVHPQAKFSMIASSVIYREILNEVRRARYQVFGRRIYVPQFTKLLVLAKSSLIT